jgi:hypothetical protein
MCEMRMLFELVREGESGLRDWNTDDMDKTRINRIIL